MLTFFQDYLRMFKSILFIFCSIPLALLAGNNSGSSIEWVPPGTYLMGDSILQINGTENAPISLPNGVLLSANSDTVGQRNAAFNKQGSDEDAVLRITTKEDAFQVWVLSTDGESFYPLSNLAGTQTLVVESGTYDVMAVFSSDYGLLEERAVVIRENVVVQTETDLTLEREEAIHAVSIDMKDPRGGRVNFQNMPLALGIQQLIHMPSKKSFNFVSNQFVHHLFSPLVSGRFHFEMVQSAILNDSDVYLETFVFFNTIESDVEKQFDSRFLKPKLFRVETQFNGNGFLSPLYWNIGNGNFDTNWGVGGDPLQHVCSVPFEFNVYSDNRPNPSRTFDRTKMDYRLISDTSKGITHSAETPFREYRDNSNPFDDKNAPKYGGFHIMGTGPVFIPFRFQMVNGEVRLAQVELSDGLKDHLFLPIDFEVVMLNGDVISGTIEPNSGTPYGLVLGGESSVTQLTFNYEVERFTPGMQHRDLRGEVIAYWPNPNEAPRMPAIKTLRFEKSSRATDTITEGGRIVVEIEPYFSSVIRTDVTLYESDQPPHPIIETIPMEKWPSLSILTLIEVFERNENPLLFDAELPVMDLNSPVNLEVKVTTGSGNYITHRIENALHINPTIHFEDPELSAHLVQMYDSNLDGQIQLSEALMIETLDISNLGIVNLEGLQQLKSLKKLDISQNDLFMMPPLETWPQIESLKASNCLLSTFPKISACVALRELDVSFNQIENSTDNCLSYWAIQEQGLETLEVNPQATGVLGCGNKDERVIFTDPFFKIRMVKQLDRDGDGEVSRGEAAEARDIEIADLSVKDLTGLEACVALEVLSLQGLNYPKFPILPESLRTFRISNCQIETLPEMAHITALRSLFVTNSLIGDLAPLAHLTNLRYLMLSNNQLASLQEVRGLINLVSLDISENPLSGFPDVSQMPALEVLKASHAGIDYLPLFSENPRLENLVVYGNDFSADDCDAVLNLLTWVRDFEFNPQADGTILNCE